MRITEMHPEFVEFIPDKLKSGILYISEQYSIVVHLCCCGCGEKVVTPLSPAEWQLTVDGSKVSLSPSIGNWNYDCRSHYFIRSNKVRWAGDLSDIQIEIGKQRDHEDMKAYIAHKNSSNKVSWFREMFSATLKFVKRLFSK